MIDSLVYLLAQVADPAAPTTPTGPPTGPPPAAPFGNFFFIAIMLALLVFILTNMRSQKKREGRQRQDVVEPRMPVINTPAFRNIIIGFLLGAAVGVPVSYFFQPGLLRAFMGLGDYLGDFGSVWSDGDCATTARVSVILCAVTGATIAALAKPRSSAP